MRRQPHFCFALLGVCCSWAYCAAQTPTTYPTQQELLDEVRALRSEVKELRAQIKSQPTGLTTMPAASSDAAGAMLTDAQRRSAFLDVNTLTASYVPGQGALIRSEDGNFLMHPWAFIQVRNASNYREHVKNGNGSDFENGFEIDRMKFILDGNLFGPDLTYQFIWATSDTTGNLGLQDAWVRYHFPGTSWAVRAGQIRDPFDHEQIIYATKSLTPERSIVNNVLANADGVVKGASIGYGYDTDSALRSEVAITGGQRNFDTTFQTFSANSADWGAAGRVEYKLFGNWADYSQFTTLGDKHDLLVIGAGADYTEAGDTGALMHVADVQYDSPSGFMVYAAYLGRYTRHNGGAIGTNGGFSGAGASFNTYDSTVRLMAAYLIGGHFEPFARYEYLHINPHELPATAAHDFISDVTLGFNYYFYGHRAKITAAASYLPDGSPISNTFSDLLATPHSGNEVIVQAQVQVIL